MILKPGIIAGVITLLFCVSSIDLIGQNRSSREELEKSLGNLLKLPALKGAGVTWCFRDVQTGRTIIAREENRLFIPASTAKIYTAAAALAILGEDYRCTTEVNYSGTILKNQLEGDLIIKGSGDPSFGHKNAEEIFGKILAALREKNIQTIKGRILLDPFLLPYNQSVLPRDRTWEDMGNYYGAGVYGINWRNNSYSVAFKPGKPGDTSKVVPLNPVPFNKSYSSEVITVTEAPEDIYLFEAPFSDYVFASGKMKAGSSEKTERGALSDPPKQFGFELKQFLQSNGIGCGEIVLARSPEEVNKLLHFISPPLSEILKEVNQKSSNLYAESITRLTGLRLGRKPTAEEASEGIRKYLCNIPDIDTLFVLREGSGLSKNNLLTSSGQTGLLRYASMQPWFKAFEESLAESGVSGTMRSFPVKGVKAKTGSINGVRAYTGYLTNAAGRKIAFSLIINNYLGSSKELNPAIATVFENAIKAEY